MSSFDRTATGSTDADRNAKPDGDITDATELTPEPSPIPLVLGPEITIAYAASTHDTLADALHAHPGDLQLDLAGVTDFDSAGVQLLLATQRSLAEHGHTLRLSAVSPAVNDALTLFGLQVLRNTSP